MTVQAGLKFSLYCSNISHFLLNLFILVLGKSGDLVWSPIHCNLYKLPNYTAAHSTVSSYFAVWFLFFSLGPLHLYHSLQDNKHVLRYLAVSVEFFLPWRDAHLREVFSIWRVYIKKMQKWSSGTYPYIPGYWQFFRCVSYQRFQSFFGSGM